MAHNKTFSSSLMIRVTKNTIFTFGLGKISIMILSGVREWEKKYCHKLHVTT